MGRRPPMTATFKHVEDSVENVAQRMVRGLPSPIGVGRYDFKEIHSASERSVG
jgi:hypothetical protein